MLVVATATCLLVPATSVQATGGAHVSVMTRNIYLGSGLSNLAQAQDLPQFIQAVTQDWNNIVANDFPRRARALATEVQLTRPDVIGLQEAMLFREQLVSDGLLNAQTVVYDFVESCSPSSPPRACRTRPSQWPRTSTPRRLRFNPASPHPLRLTDVRITDRDVILVRKEIARKFFNPMDADYAAQLQLPSPGGPLTFTRGSVSIDYRITSERTVRIFNTHLEVRESGPIQVAQGAEFVQRVNRSPFPVIALGDFNSAADGSTTPTYANLIAAGLQDAWTAVQPRNPGRHVLPARAPLPRRCRRPSGST